MIMMIVIGGEIHQMEHPPVGPGTYGFLVGPGPICTFVFAKLSLRSMPCDLVTVDPMVMKGSLYF